MKLKQTFTKFKVSVCSDYEDCRLRGYDAVWNGINLLTCRRKVLYPYHTPETSVSFYHTARRHVTADFKFNNLSVVFHMIFGKFMAAVNYTNLVKEKSHLHVRFPVWFPGLDLVYFVHRICSQQ